MTNPPTNDPRTKYEALERQFAEDVDQLSDAELLREAAEDGLDSSAIARDMRAAAMSQILTAKRSLLALAKSEMERARQSSPNNTRVRPSIDVIKARLSELFGQNPNLAVAFRSGKSQSDSDWASLWDDLVDLGELKDANGSD